MHYLSPATLFGPTFRPPFDIKTIQRERKKLLVELELSGGEVLEYNGHRFTKNELLGYFEELEQENIAHYHALVSEDPVLLEFLQKRGIPKDARFKDIPADPGFITWISPYFYDAFVTFVTHCFDHPNATAMRALLDNPLLMTGRDKERSWLFITGILEKNIALFDHYRGRGQKKSPKPMPIERVTHFLRYEYVLVIKQLPDSQFASLKDNYAHQMQHPAIATFNRDPHNRALSVVWVETALDLAVSSSVKQRIQEKLNELNRILKKNRRRTYMLALYGLVVVLGVIKALVDTNDDHPDYIGSPESTPVVVHSRTPAADSTKSAGDATKSAADSTRHAADSPRHAAGSPAARSDTAFVYPRQR